MNVVRTYTGRNVSLAVPDASTIEIRDIACSLSRINRFNGSTRLPLNVADHSLNVVRWLSLQKAPPVVQMLGLLHDAHEAYIGDITAPVRRELCEWAGRDIVQRIAERLDQAIRVALGLNRHVETAHLALVHLADQCVLAAEWRDLMEGTSPFPAQPVSFAIKPRNADQSELTFLKTFDQLRLDIGPQLAASISN